MDAIIKELLESSSSSSDDEFLFVKEREKHHRVKNFLEDVVHNYSAKEFKANFRVTKETAGFLVEEYGESELYSCRNYSGGRQQLSAEKEMLSFIWFTSNKSSMREVCNLFDFCLSAFHRIINKVLNYFTSEVARKTIKMPCNSAEKEAIANEFEAISGFPNVLGCVDGTYINIKAPRHKIKSTYCNRHDTCSLTLQGICDAKKRFLDVYTGSPSKIHDARIFKMSFISEEIEKICESKYHLLGDAAYPIREYLLTPYRDYGNLDRAQRKYNLVFCQTPVRIENAFGLLKCRFRQLKYLDFHSVQSMAKFIIACCALHNLCIDRNDGWDEDESYQEERVDDYNYHSDSEREVLLKRLGEIKRHNITTILSNQNIRE